MTQEQFYNDLLDEFAELNETMEAFEFAFYAAICGEFGRYPDITNALLKGYYNGVEKGL